ncbi:MAG: CsbD family protein [Janthinobacterium lividum]
MNRDQIEGALQDAAGKVQQTVGMATGDAGRRIDGFAPEVAGKSRYAYGKAQDGLDDLTEAARDLRDDVTDRASDAYDRVRRGSAPVRRHVERHPLTDLLIVGALGYVLGFLSNGARR